MHIAFLTSILPDGHPTSGYEIANEAILHGLEALGHRVTCIGFRLPRQKPARAADVVLATMDMENAGASALDKALFVARALATGLPISASKLRAVSKVDATAAFRDAGPFDAVIANSYQMAAAFPEMVVGDFGFVAHNVEHVSARQNALSAGGRLTRALYARDARLLERIEHDLAARAGFVWALSDDDRSALAAGKPSAVLPLIVPGVGASQSAPQTHDVGLIGTWTWEPNRVGLAWFLEQVVPLLDPSLRIAVAGKTPPGLPVPANVEVLGRVKSADGFLAGVGVVPLVSQGGTGVQLKTIEAFQAGLSCVATASALRGVDTLPPNARRADDAPAFAAAIKDLLAAPQDNGNAARAFYDRQRKAMLNALDRGLNAIPRIS